MATSHSVNLSWVASTDPVTGYNVYKGTAAGAETTLLTATPITALTFDDTTEVAGTYFYVVTSILNGVESLHSNEVSVSLRPAPPTALTVVSAS
jgi:titin